MLLPFRLLPFEASTLFFLCYNSSNRINCLSFIVLVYQMHDFSRFEVTVCLEKTLFEILNRC